MRFNHFRFALLLGVICLFNASVRAAGYGPGDILIADFSGDRIAVYDSGFTFQGYLNNSTGFDGVAGLDLTAGNNLVAVNRNNARLREYDSAGNVISNFVNGSIGLPIDVKIGPNGNAYVGTQSGATGVLEVSLAGVNQGTYTGASWDAVAIIPNKGTNGVLWAGTDGFAGTITEYDLVTRASLGSISIGAGRRASTMHYDSVTDRVLISDTNTDDILEFNPAGTLTDTLTGVGIGNSQGLWRLPNGTTYATGGTDVYEFNAAGTHVATHDISGDVTHALGIVVVPVPLPAAAWAGLILLCGLGAARSRNRSRTSS